MSDKKSQLLPLGTAVKIKNDDSYYIIISRGFQKKNGEIVSGYAGIPHPYGQNSQYKTMIISTDIITEVVHQGYEDELDMAFTKEQIKKIVDAPQKKQVSMITEDTNSREKAPSLLVSTKTTDVQKKSEHPYDPFYELKQKYKKSVSHKIKS